MRVLRSITIGVAVALVTTAPALAQRTAIPRGRSAGIAGGVTITRLSGYINTVEDRTGPFIGVYGARDISDNFGLQLEVNWVRKGGKGILPAPVDEHLWDMRIDYLEIPLTVNYLRDFSEDWGFGAYTGIGIGFALSCRADIGSGPGPAPCEDTVLGGTNTDWTIPFGAKIGRNFSGGSSLYLDVRYALGLSNVTDFVAGGVQRELKNRAWEIVLRWGYPMR